MSTFDAIGELIPNDQKFTYPGVFRELDIPNSRIGSLQGNAEQQSMRYGYRPVPDNPAIPIVPPKFAAQATNMVKSCKLIGYRGAGEIIYEAQVWMRVYREVYYPSITPNSPYRTKLYGVNHTQWPILPTVEYVNDAQNYIGGQHFYRFCSIPTNSSKFQTVGAYTMLYLIWSGRVPSTSGSPSYGTTAVLFDHYHSGNTLKVVDLNYQPTNSMTGKTKSGIKEFYTGPLNDIVTTGHTLGGKSIFAHNDGGVITKYFLHDDSDHKWPVMNGGLGHKPGSSSGIFFPLNTPAVITSEASYAGSSLSLHGNIETGTSKPTGARPGQKNKDGLTYSPIVLKKNGTNYLIACDEETVEKIDLHLQLAGASVDFGFSKTNGKEIISSGGNQNYVGPNIEFGNKSSNPKIWEPLPRGSNQENSVYLNTVVIDGTILNSLPATLDDTWIQGYAPTVNTDIAIEIAREHYYYVLANQKRIQHSGGCHCTNEGDMAGHATAFTSPSGTPSGDCTRGLHFGKFLKSTSAALPPYSNAAKGFLSTDFNAYQAALQGFARLEARLNLTKTKFEGRISSDTAHPTEPITFTLNGVVGFEASGNAVKYPKKSGVTTTGIKTLTPTPAEEEASKEDEKNAGTVPGTPGAPVIVIPRDWKKHISVAMDRLFSGTTVEKLTPERLAKFMNNQVLAGTPLPLLKERVLASIVAAKLAAIQASGIKNKKNAMQVLMDDPAYIALAQAVNTTKRLTKPTAPVAPGSPGSNGSTNAEGAAAKTIRITVVRGLPGYRGGIRPAASVEGKPELVQTYVTYKKGVVGSAEPRRFVFPFTPKEVNYSGIGTVWTEIPRSGNFPIVDWTGFNLLKISFNFDIVNTDYKDKQGFGLHYSCEDQIRRLREMAQTPYPVTFLNMDKFMQEEVRWPLLTSGRGIEFVIQEFSVTAVQRTPFSASENSPYFGLEPNQISRATCSMTLQEIPIENVDIVQMPPILPCKPKNSPGKLKPGARICPGDDIPKEDLKRYLLYTDGTNRSV